MLNDRGVCNVSSKWTKGQAESSKIGKRVTGWVKRTIGGFGRTRGIGGRNAQNKWIMTPMMQPLQIMLSRCFMP